MVGFKVSLLFAIVAIAAANPTSRPAFWKGTALDNHVEEMRSLCAEDDTIACLKFKALSFLDSLLQKDYYQISENIEVSRNSYSPNEVGRSSSSVEETVETYLKTHDATFKLPIVGSTLTMGARNLDSDELDFSINFSSGNQVEARKSKLKKILIPLLVFVLLKAIVLVPLALGVLGLKAWNALQLSFFSFILAVGLAIFQLCKKIASDNAHPQIAAHSAWQPDLASHYAARQFDENVNFDAQPMAYSAYLQ